MDPGRKKPTNLGMRLLNLPRKAEMSAEIINSNGKMQLLVKF